MATTGPRRALLLVAAVAMLGVSACGLLSPPLPPLLRDLPSNGNSASQVFDRRLRDTFPPGSSAQQLKDELTRNGFELMANSDKGSSLQMARFDEKPAGLQLVRLRAFASWEADGQGRIVRTNGSIALVGL